MAVCFDGVEEQLALPECSFFLFMPLCGAFAAATAAAAGKVSRISAAYGQVASARKGGGTAHSTSSYPRGNTGEM